MGLKAAWINRDNAIMGVKGVEGPRPDWTFGSMAELARTMEEVLSWKKTGDNVRS